MATQNSSSSGKPYPVDEGGTGATTASAARTNLGCNNASNLDSGTVSTSLYTRTGIYRHTDIDAGAMVPRSTNGAEALTVAGTNDETDVFAFDSVTEEGVQFKWAIPEEWAGGTLKVKFYWEPDTGASASDGVTWGIAAKAVGNDDALDGAFPASVDTDDTVIAVGDEHIVISAAVTISGTPVAGDEILFEITRVVGDANDDMAEDALLRKIVIQWLESTTEPSAW